MSLELFAVFNLLLFALTIWVNGLDIAIAGVLTSFVIGFVEINKAIFNRFGDISYSLYLTHGLVGGNLLYLLNRYTKTHSSSFFLMLGAIVLSLVVSFYFWKWIEKPSKDISKKIGA
jgi:peptidoglycan/LPS O-acetylase OafA/YrhL